MWLMLYTVARNIAYYQNVCGLCYILLPETLRVTKIYVAYVIYCCQKHCVLLKYMWLMLYTVARNIAYYQNICGL
jgi:hypothetical protein